VKSETINLRSSMPKPCGFYHRNLTVLDSHTTRIAQRYVDAPSRGETRGSLDSAPTYCEAIRVHAGSESYASRLGIHVWREPYVCAPSRGATREVRDSGRLSAVSFLTDITAILEHHHSILPYFSLSVS